MSEWRRIFVRKSMVGLVLLLFFINGILFLEEHGISVLSGFREVKTQLENNHGTYRKVMELLSEYEGRDALEAEKSLSEKQQEFLYQDKEWTPEEYGVSLMEIQMSSISSFQRKVESVLERAEQMKKSSSMQSAYALRNIEKTAKDYESILDIELEAGYNLAVSALAKYTNTEFITFIFLLVIILFFLEERRKGLWNLMYAMPRGRTHMAGIRTIMMLVSALLFTIFLWIENLFLAILVYGGLGDVSRSIQSVPGCENVMWHVSIWQFIVLEVLGKALTLAILGLLCFIALSYPKMPVIGVGILVLIIGAEYSAWIFIQKWSGFSAFKYMNLFEFLNTGNLMVNYLNLNIFGYPLEISTLFWVSVPALLLVLGVFAVLSGNIYPVNGSGKLRRGKRNSSGRRIWIPCFHEFYKQAIAQGGILVLIFLIIFSIHGLDIHQVYYGYSMQLYLNYIEALEGPFLPEKQDYLEEEQKALLNKIEEELQLNGESGYYKELVSADKMLSDLIVLSGQYADWTKKGVNVEYINYIGYDKLYGRESDRTERIQAIEITMFLILTIGGLFAYERQQGMEIYLKTLSYGRERVRRRKYGIAMFYAVSIPLIVYGFQFYEISKNYGLDGLTSSLQSISTFVEIPLRVTVWEFLVLLFAFRVTAACAIAFFVLFLSEHSSGIIQSMVKSAVLLVLPAGMVYLGAESLKDISIFSPLCIMGNYHNAGAFQISVFTGFISTIVLAGVSAGVVEIKSRRNRHGNITIHRCRKKI